MRGNELLDKMGLIAPAYIEEAEQTPKKKKKAFLKWGAIAACLCLTAAGIFGAVKTGLIPLGSRAGYGGGSASAADTEAGLTYMFYAGPVFPLSTLEPADSLTAERNVNFDFSPYRTHTDTVKSEEGTFYDVTYHSESLISDSYTLTDHGSAAQTVTLVYPFAADLQSDLSELPQMTVDGSAVQPDLHIGPYFGNYHYADNEKDVTDEKQILLNAQKLNSWEGYKAAVEADYQSLAFDGLPALSQPVTVYEISDIYGEVGENGLSPQLEWSTVIDFDRTTILSYGFDSISFDTESGSYACAFSVPQSDYPNYGESKYLIVYGDDTESYTLQGYRKGTNKTPTENAGAVITRYETTLGAIIRKTAEQYLKAYSYDDDAKTIISAVSLDTFCGLAAEALENYGILSADSEWYLESLEMVFGEVRSRERILYLTFDVTVPADSSVSVCLAFTKQASRDYVGESINRNGYDMVTTLGSSLIFSEQSASVSSTDDIRILRQNFGFDLANGIDRVELDLTEEHYYLEVAKKHEK